MASASATAVSPEAGSGVATPLDGVTLILADLDGVVYKGAGAIPGAVESLNRAASANARVGYITNNAARTAESVAEHLSSLGLTATADDVVTSPQAAVRLLLELIPAGAEVLVVGGEGLIVEVEKAGLCAVSRSSDNTAAVIQGFSPTVAWNDLAEAAFALQGEHAERPWVATNTDWTIPVARGIAPGNGTLVSAVHTAVGRLPIVAGKPEVAIFESAIERFGTREALFIGDRLDTDILGANRAGIPSVLVLTGVDKAKQVLAADKTMRPGFILSDLTQLFEPYPATVESVDSDSGGRRFSVGEASVVLNGNKVRLVSSGARPIDELRAGAAAIWGSGLAIYGLDVDPALYEER